MLEPCCRISGAQNRFPLLRAMLEPCCRIFSAQNWFRLLRAMLWLVFPQQSSGLGEVSLEGAAGGE
jgi:hypothetical protein